MKSSFCSITRECSSSKLVLAVILSYCSLLIRLDIPFALQRLTTIGSSPSTDIIYVSVISTFSHNIEVRFISYNCSVAMLLQNTIYFDFLCSLSPGKFTKFDVTKFWCSELFKSAAINSVIISMK